MQDIFRFTPDLAASTDKRTHTGPAVLSRRKFLKDAAVIIGALAAGGVLAGCGSSGSENPRPIEVDLDTLNRNREFYVNSRVTTVGKLEIDSSNGKILVAKQVPDGNGGFVWITSTTLLSTLSSPVGYEKVGSRIEVIGTVGVDENLIDTLNWIKNEEFQVTGTVIRIRPYNSETLESFAIDPSITVPFPSTPTSK